MQKSNVGKLQHTLLCNQAMREGKPQPAHKLRQERQPIRLELQIKGPLWSNILPELRAAWARESTENKEKVITQFKVPVVKNSQLTAYESNIRYADVGYESDVTDNTHNSEHTYAFQAGTEFDTTASVNSNGELEGNPPSDLLVNATSSIASILRNKK